MSYYQKPRPLGSVLDAWVDRMGWKNKINESRVVESWAEIAGPLINGVTESAWMKNNILFVKISSAPWRHELHLNRVLWKNKLNEALGQEIVKEIIFR